MNHQEEKQAWQAPQVSNLSSQETHGLKPGPSKNETYTYSTVGPPS